jgi:hypothetical protein
LADRPEAEGLVESGRFAGFSDRKREEMVGIGLSLAVRPAFPLVCEECAADGCSAVREVPFISRRAFSFRSKM